MIFTISKDYAFSASHVLHRLPDDHQCARLHGHNYVVRVEITHDQLDDHGFVLDYGDLTPFGRWLDDTVDHRHLNDVIPNNAHPTAERLAAWCVGQVSRLTPIPPGATIAVGVSETPKTWAWCRAVMP